MTTKLASQCGLCGVETGEQALVEGELAFCCAGCHSVYRILLAKRQLQDFEQHPVFQQAVQAGLVSNPRLLQQLREKRVEVPQQELERLHLQIGEMWCPSCAEIIRLMLLQHKGVQQAAIDYSTDLAAIEFAPRFISRERILKTIRGLGYTAELLEDHSGRKISRLLWLRLGVAAFCTLNVMMFAYPLYASALGDDSGGYSPIFAWLGLFFALPVVTFSAWPIWKRFWASMQVALFGMETLVVMGMSTAFGLSLYQLSQGRDEVYFDSLCALITLVLLGKVIEAKAKFSARETLFRLTRSLPRRGRKRFADGTEDYIPLKDFSVDDLLVVHSGETVVLDGEVVEGEGACDESLMTGESLPVTKKPGDRVVSGSILSSGSLCLRVTRVAEQSMLAKLIELVEPQLEHKARYERAVDPIVRAFVPFVLLLASVAAGWVYLTAADANAALLRAITVLLISCPCAVGLAAPLSEALLMRRLSELGVLVRNRGVLKLLGREALYVFDKTGTLTEGKLCVSSGLDQLTGSERRILKALARPSLHPLPSAVYRAISEDPAQLDGVREIVGQGMQAGDYRLGSAPFCSQPDEGSTETTLYFCKGKELITEIRLSDTLREDAAEAVAGLPALLLSGDAELPVRNVAKACGIKDARWRVSPLEKQRIVSEARKMRGYVCVVGDGMNDAPALSAADIGISVLSATDLSVQVSDILLSTPRLSVLRDVRRLGRLGRRILHQNLFWAFFYNIVGLGLAMSGQLSPLFATVAMVLSSLMVIGNAQRLR